MEHDAAEHLTKKVFLGTALCAALLYKALLGSPCLAAVLLQAKQEQGRHILFVLPFA